MKKNVNEQIDEVLKVAKQQGLEENFFFNATFNDYKRQRIIIAKLASEIDAAIVDKSGKPNSCIQQYNKSVDAASKLALVLIQMVYGISGAAVQNVMGEEKECPDFENMPTKDIVKWCKKYDIDPNDYSKRFLVKALAKRWRFDNE